MTNSQRVLDWLRNNGKGNCSSIAASLKLRITEVAKILLMLKDMGLVKETSDLGYYYTSV
jgi:DNA-binding IclR family transcriptional regulator